LPAVTADTSDILDRRKQLMGSAYRLFYDRPVHLVRGQGVWLWDAEGCKYLDMYNNVPHVGHCHPRVVEAICRQAGVLNTHTRYLHENVLDLAERLIARLPGAMNTVMFCCTGSEANELALRIARTVTGGTGIIVTDHAYHGNTQAIYEISTDSIPVGQIPEYVVTVPAPDAYRGEYRGDDAGERYAEHVNDAIGLLRSRGIRPAAFVIDTIVSSSGVVSPPKGYLRRVADIVQDAGFLFVADEVQPGFGRTGRHFWGFEADGIEPDIVTMGKPMGNGHPISAVATRSDIADEFGCHGRYFNTFGGNPVACAAALAVLDIIEEESLQQSALEVGDYVVAALQRMAARHDCIGDVRGHGLFLAVELVDDAELRTPATPLAKDVVNKLRERGVLTGSIGPDDNILKLRPPMVLTRSDADCMLGILDATLGDLG
jgi:4-aminobutyrate aminotransferase-like enzyme